MDSVTLIGERFPHPSPANETAEAVGRQRTFSRDPEALRRSAVGLANRCDHQVQPRSPPQSLRVAAKRPLA